MEPGSRLTGPRAAVVTGSAHGVGRLIATECARRGMDVVVADLDIKTATDVATGISATTGRRALAVGVDVAERDDVDRLAATSYAELGGVHLLFNNAGATSYGTIAESEMDDWKALLDVNLWGPLHGVQAFLPRMRAQNKPAHIVNSSSLSGLVCRHNHRGIYQAVKQALVAMTDSLRDELAAERSNVSASCWCPGHMQLPEPPARAPGELGGPVTYGKHPPREAHPIAAEVAIRRLFEGIGENRRYILTHPHLRSDVEEHYARLFADMDAGAAIASRVG